MTGGPVTLDSHRNMAAQKAIDVCRLRYRNSTLEGETGHGKS